MSLEHIKEKHVNNIVIEHEVNIKDLMKKKER